jgi:hypothetical protein
MGVSLEGSQALVFAVTTNKDERYLFVELLYTLNRFVVKINEQAFEKIQRMTATLSSF